MRCFQELNCAYVRKGDQEADADGLVEEIGFQNTVGVGGGEHWQGGR